MFNIISYLYLNLIKKEIWVHFPVVNTMVIILDGSSEHDAHVWTE